MQKLISKIFYYIYVLHKKVFQYIIINKQKQSQMSISIIKTINIVHKGGIIILYGEERKAEILEQIKANSRVSVPELSHFFNVSESTIRRDLKELEEAKLIQRTHGGAIAVDSVNYEPSYLEKEDKFQKEKEAIAKKAVEFINEGDTLILDSGTTTFHLVKELRKFKKLTVVTNSLMLARELEITQGIDLIIIGGFLRKETLAMVGPLAERSLERMKVDKAFIGTNGIDLKEGITTPNLIEAETKRKMIQSAKEVILLADHTKIGKVAFAKVADITEINKCVFNSEVSESVVKSIEELGVDVYTVEA